MIIKEGCFTEGAQDFFLTPNKESSGPEVKESTLLSYNLPYHPWKLIIRILPHFITKITHRKHENVLCLF